MISPAELGFRGIFRFRYSCAYRHALLRFF